MLWHAQNLNHFRFSWHWELWRFSFVVINFLNPTRILNHPMTQTSVYYLELREDYYIKRGTLYYIILREDLSLLLMNAVDKKCWNLTEYWVYISEQSKSSSVPVNKSTHWYDMYILCNKWYIFSCEMACAILSLCSE